MLRESLNTLDELMVRTKEVDGVKPIGLLLGTNGYVGLLIFQIEYSYSFVVGFAIT